MLSSSDLFSEDCSESDGAAVLTDSEELLRAAFVFVDFFLGI